jgi:hypothetical protein
MYRVSQAAMRSYTRQPPQASRFSRHSLISIPSQRVVALVSRSVMVCSLLVQKVREQNRVQPATGEWGSLFVIIRSQDQQCDVEKAVPWQSLTLTSYSDDSSRNISQRSLASRKMNPWTWTHPAGSLKSLRKISMKTLLMS